MRVWLDIENPPQVQYLAPLKGAFEAQGHTVKVTAMQNSITLELLAQRGIDAHVIGAHGGSTKARKVARILSRAARLDGHLARDGRPQVLVGASRSAAMAAWSMRVPAFTFCDYEHVDLRVLRLTRGFVIFPDVIDQHAFTSRGIRTDRLIPMRALKEAISFNGIELPSTAPDPFELDRSIRRVLLRPPGEETHYFVPESRDLFVDLLRWLAGRSELVVVFAPRYPHQRSYLDALSWTNEPVVLDHGIPFTRLLGAVDILVSSGGTMLREAAFLGIPAFSILRSEIGQVDRYLEHIGRVEILDSPASFEALLRASAIGKPLADDHELVPELVTTIVERASGNGS